VPRGSQPLDYGDDLLVATRTHNACFWSPPRTRKCRYVAALSGVGQRSGTALWRAASKL